MRVFAPGKIVLTGAYAVLEGAPAIVVATSRGAFADGSAVSPSPSPEVRAAFGDAPAPKVDASALFVGSRKIGLGASAAILVASLALRELERGADPRAIATRERVFAHARAAHAAAQGGGSGVDIAASVWGGALRYVLPGGHVGKGASGRVDAASATRVELPTGTCISVFGCGNSASTSELRGKVDRLAAADAKLHRALLDELGAIARAASEAVELGAPDALVDAVGRAARALDRLGVAAGAPIVPEGFASLEDVARNDGAAFCVSGAGGGDIAVHVGRAAPSPEFLDRARRLGLIALDLDFDWKGVRLAPEVASYATVGAS